MKIAPKKPLNRGVPQGFALVITVSLMVLLTVIVVGLLTLSAVSLRAVGHGDAASIARSNARLGMMLALGELQAGMGPDRRVSARADVVKKSAQSPHLTGVWETPRGGAPASSPASYYEATKPGTFRGWLVSTATPEQAADRDLPAVDPSDPIQLVPEFENSRGRERTGVRAQKVPVTLEKGRGHYAYAVFDESTKAAIDRGDLDPRPTGAVEVATRTAPHRFRADALRDLGELANALAKPKNLVSLETAVVPGGGDTADDLRRRFHDFTTDSVGLLVDTANGGLRTDLTSLFEATSLDSRAFPSDTLYETANSGAPRWRYLHDHYRKYRDLQGGTALAGTPRMVHPKSGLDVRPKANGVDLSPDRERLLPVIAKLQLIFSIVAHNAHIPDRVQFYESEGVPRGNHNHAVPHLVYDPVVTLYNPYDVELDLSTVRIRIWDPPVGFRFAKVAGGGTNWYRNEMADRDRGFIGLGQFSHANENTPTARKHFNLSLTDGSDRGAGRNLILRPGEVKVYSPRVERNWTWGLETSGGYTPRAFFDWNPDNKLGEVDFRSKNNYGVDTVPGWISKAGLQTDHMSNSRARPTNTVYDFERSRFSGVGFVSIRLTDEVRVEARPQKVVPTSIPNDFQVDLLAGLREQPEQDILRSYMFSFTDPQVELAEFPEKPVIERQYLVGDIMQRAGDTGVAGKTPFAMLEMAARTTVDPLDRTKAWIFNNPVVEGGRVRTSAVGLANESYDVRLVEMRSFEDFPSVELDPETNRGYFGPSKTAEGATNVPMYRVAQAPAASLGDLIPSNLIAGAQLPRVVHAFGNSHAHPLIPVGDVRASSTVVDHSYHLNRTLWDRYYFSSIANYDAGLAAQDGRGRAEVLEDVLAGTRPALNTRLRPASAPGDPSAMADELSGLSDLERSRMLAAHLAIGGPFNLNSTSIDAWVSVLAALRDRQVTVWGNRSVETNDRAPFARMNFPLAGPAEENEGAGFNVLGQIRWAGFRTLDDGQIEDLAKAIVNEIRLRGEADGAPSLTIAEFVNRRPGSGIHNQKGILQTAIDKSGVNRNYQDNNEDSKAISASDVPPLHRRGVNNAEAMSGFTGEGSPAMLTQGDLMMALAGVAAVRGDTFKIRSYGEATAADGTVLARAWCEAVVQRVPEYMDPVDSPEKADQLNPVNERFGRRFQVVSFRWLKEEEVLNEGSV
jgi:hypothetical protein